MLLGFIAAALLGTPEVEVAIAAQVIGEGGADEPEALMLAQETARAVGFASGVAAAEERRELEASLLACGPDERCLARRLRGAGVGLALLVLLDARAPGLLSLQLVDASTGHVVERSATEVEASKALASVAEQVMALLERNQRTVQGRLLVEVSPREADLVLEPGALPIVAGRAARVPPGAYTVSARAAGHLPARAPAEVRRGEESRVALHLEREPASVLSSPLLWIALGAATIAGGAAVIAALSGGTPVLCHQHDAAACP